MQASEACDVGSIPTGDTKIFFQKLFLQNNFLLKKLYTVLIVDTFTHGVKQFILHASGRFLKHLFKKKNFTAMLVL